MDLYDNELYMEDVKNILRLNLSWSSLYNKSILVSGATGLIGSILVDILLELNSCKKVFALSRNEDMAKKRFKKWSNNEILEIIRHDITRPDINITVDNIDYVFHLASNTHPKQYSSDPIGTIETNIVGLKNMLDLTERFRGKRLLFASSVEIYGENRGDVEFFDEKYCGYINSNTMRAGYPESKRCGEALCQAYKAQKGLDIVIARLARTYGPTMLMTDSRAIGQFIKKGIASEDVILKSDGTQYYSYIYVMDAVAGLLTILLNGVNGEAYNIADENSDIMLKDLAAIIAGVNGKEVVFEIPDPVEAAGYSTATKARLDGHKLQALGWIPKYDIKTGIERTIRILKELQE